MAWVLRLLWRRHWVVLPLAVLSVALVVVNYQGTPPTYRVAGSVVLFNPPPPPRDAPADAGSPFLRFGDGSVVVDIVARLIATEPVKKDLQRRGAVGDYTVAANIAFYHGPIIDVSAEASDPSAARRTATLVMAEVGRQLDALQAAQGVSREFFIRPVDVVEPGRPELIASARLRHVIPVALGLALVVVGITAVIDGLARAGARRRGRDHPATADPSITVTAPPVPVVDRTAPVPRSPASAAGVVPRVHS